VGPTAAGKSELAIGLASRLGGEVLSVDSMQVYREMDVGTAKPDATTRGAVPHHLLDLVDPEFEFTVAEFQEVGVGVRDRLRAESITPVVCGGSGLHFRALVDPLEFPPTDPKVRAELEQAGHDELVAALQALDPHAAEHVDLANPRRVVRALEIQRITGLTPSERAASAAGEAVRRYLSAVPMLVLGFDPGEALADRVAARFDRMLDRGLLEEVERLAPRLGRTARQAVGYKELLPVVQGGVDLAEARDEALRATLALAKRQRTFFGKDPRVHWIPWHHDPAQRLERALAAVEEAER
jgi:tRNA dimethylallyltransferase